MSIKNRIQEFRVVPKSMLLPNPKNWRTHPEAQRAALRGVLAEVGIADAVIARELPDGRLMLVDGHLRLEELPDDVPTLVLDVNEAEADKLLASMDPLAAMAEADAAKLDELLRGVQTAEPALADMFTELAEEAGLLDGDDKEIVEDEAPEPPADPITKPGDLWLLGDHRLLCGDSTKAEDVARLMAGTKANLCFTSPPYCAGKAGWSDGEKYNHGDDSDLGKWNVLLNNFVELAIAYSDVVFVNLQMVSRNRVALIEWLHSRKKNIVDIAIWDKSHGAPAMQPGVFSGAFEFIFILASGEPTRMIPGASWRGTQSNVARVKREHNAFAEIHRAIYPVALPAWGIDVVNTSKSVYEPFCGTGTTLIAAEQLGRKCYGMEISPEYCDVIVARWEKLTGRKATRG